MMVDPINVIENLSDFKWWRLQNSNAAKLAKEIVFRWRGSSTRVKSKHGKWAAYPREKWRMWTGLSRNQLDRSMRELEQSGFILREQHRFAGTKVLGFVQPTELALKYFGKIGDLNLVVNTDKKSAEHTAKHTAKNFDEKTSEKISEKTDYTSFPSLSTKSTESTFLPSALQKKKKGKAGMKLKLPNKIEEAKPLIPMSLESKSTNTENAPSICTQSDDENNKLDVLIAAIKKQKQEKEKKVFKEKKGPHEESVIHPSIKFPGWSGFSTGVKVKLQAKYEEYVENWYKGKEFEKHKMYTPMDEDSETTEMVDFDDPDIEEVFFANGGKMPGHMLSLSKPKKFGD